MRFKNRLHVERHDSIGKHVNLTEANMHGTRISLIVVIIVMVMVMVMVVMMMTMILVMVMMIH